MRRIAGERAWERLSTALDRHLQGGRYAGSLFPKDGLGRTRAQRPK
jgi:hypothetical protein